jgi:mannose-6-phosphate isomerase
MGTHPTLPSRLLTGGGETLGEHLRQHPELLGSRGLDDLPFLFKVLAIRKALSIQSHPDKKFAERLHALAPNLYKGEEVKAVQLPLLLSSPKSTDPNHKPEMAIALTPFRAMCGFRELHEIREFVLNMSPEVFALGDPSIVKEFVDNPSRDTFKPFFENIMKADADQVKVAIHSLLRDCTGGLRSNKLEGEEKKVVKLAVELNEQFPGDVGIFCAFFLQVIDLAPGGAIFLGAGEPHAYISGGALRSRLAFRLSLTPIPMD